jgi:hypothetical protein
VSFAEASGAGARSRSGSQVATRLQACGRELYVDFCLQYAAFLDCTLAPVQRPASELEAWA